MMMMRHLTKIIKAKNSIKSIYSIKIQRIIYYLYLKAKYQKYLKP